MNSTEEAKRADDDIAAFDRQLVRATENITEVRGVAASTIDVLGTMDRMLEKIDAPEAHTRGVADDIGKLRWSSASWRRPRRSRTWPRSAKTC